MKEKWESIRYGPLQLAVICMLVENHKAKRYTSLDELIEKCYRTAHRKKPKSGDVRRVLARTIRHINIKLSYVGVTIDRVTNLGKFGKAQYNLKGNIDLVKKTIHANIERGYTHG